MYSAKRLYSSGVCVGGIVFEMVYLCRTVYGSRSQLYGVCGLWEVSDMGMALAWIGG